MMRRMQILLDLETKMAVKELSKREGKSVSQIVRESISKTIEKKTKKLTSYEFLKRLAERAGHGPGDSEYDKYAYGL